MVGHKIPHQVKQQLPECSPFLKMCRTFPQSLLQEWELCISVWGNSAAFNPLPPHWKSYAHLHLAWWHFSTLSWGKTAWTQTAVIRVFHWSSLSFANPKAVGEDASEVAAQLRLGWKCTCVKKTGTVSSRRSIKIAFISAYLGGLWEAIKDWILGVGGSCVLLLWTCQLW